MPGVQASCKSQERELSVRHSTLHLWTEIKGGRRWGALLNQVAEAPSEDSLYETKNIMWLQSCTQYSNSAESSWRKASSPSSVSSLTRWVQDNAYSKPFLLSPPSPITCYTIALTRIEISVSAKNSTILVACYSSDLSRFIFTQKKKYWKQVPFSLRKSFNY